MVSAPTRVSLTPFLNFWSPGRFRVQGWDPVLIISQIVSLQALHYMTLALVLPPLVNAFSNRPWLAYEGGPAAIGLVLDWRQFTGKATSTLPYGTQAARVAERVKTAAGGGLVALGADVHEGVVRLVPRDSMRGWAVAAGWLAASLVDVLYLYTLIRRPTHILDSSCTLVFIHLILTTYYSDSFPWSVFYWIVVGGATVAQVIVAEQWCVAREMREGFSVDSPILMGTARMTQSARISTPNTDSTPTPRQYERVPTREEQ